MNPKVHEMMTALAQLPETEQIRIAESVLSEIKWNLLFNDPRSDELLNRLAAQARKDVAEGKVKDLSTFLNEVADHS